jgi:biotin transport system substrate-specific component
MISSASQSTGRHPTLITRVAAESPAVGILAALGVTALTAAAAQVSVPLPFTPVPFTLQTLVVLLGGAALGARLGMAAQLTYLALGIAGLPVFAASPALPQGIGRLFGPTGGYLLCYPLAAFITGALAARGWDRRYVTALLAMTAGLAVIFAGGVLWLAFLAQPLAPDVTGAVGLRRALATGFFPFIPADVIKLVLAAGVLPSIWKMTGTPSERTN